MAKIRANNFLDIVDEVFTEATKQGVLHLYADGDIFTEPSTKNYWRDVLL